MLTDPRSRSHPALRWLLAVLLFGFTPSLWAACTAANPNAKLTETTPTSDFTVNGDGTVTHSKTGLIWDQCHWNQSGATCTGSASTHTWAQALAVAVTANTNSHKGRNDWRLPNIKELQSIVETCGSNPAINQTVFPNASASYVWSASSSALNPASAWSVGFYDGNVYADAKSYDFPVRLVRGGQSLDTFDLLDRVTVSKALAGAAASNVPAGTLFPITLTCGATVLGPLNATTTTSAVFTNVPPGSCTVSEGTMPTVVGVTWGTPSYSTAQPITVSAGANTAVTVTNTANVTTYAVTATASPTAGGTASCSPNPVNHGSNANCTATPATGYTFSGWGGDCSGTGACSFTGVTAAKSVTASFTLNSYAITATASPTAGGTASCSPNPVNHGSNANCTATPATGYTFSGWGGDCSGTGACSFTGVTAAKSVTASFSQNSYAVTATGGAGGSISPASQTVNHGGTTTFTITPNAGYTAAVTGCGGSLSGTTYTTGAITGACTVTASFTLNSYAVTATGGAGGSISPASQTVNHGGTTTFTITPNAGYTAAVTGCGGSLSGTTYTTGAITGACTVTASFSQAPPNTHTIATTSSPTAGGMVSCTPNPVNQGGSATCTATPAAGYTFSSWSGDCTGTSACTLTNVTGAKSVTASFSQAPPNTHTITITGGTATTGGTVSCSPNPVPQGGSATCTATPNPGYTFNGWSGACTGTGICTLTNVTGDINLTPSFSQAPPNTHTITITGGTATTGGTVSCSPNPVPQGGSATCTATPNPGYTFNGWSGACTGTGICTLTNVTGDINLTPSFSQATQKTYSAPTATGTGNATVAVSGGGETCSFSDARFVPLSSVATAPAVGYSFPHGLFKFTLTQCTVSSTVTLSIRYPAPLPQGTSYWKYGPTSDQAEHWYRLSQASINGDTVTFNITDGGLGDNDLKADGAISDPSGPAAPATDIPTLSEWAMLILLTVLLGMGGWTLRRRQAF